MTGPNDEWPILADPNPDDEEWPLQPNIAPRTDRADGTAIPTALAATGTVDIVRQGEAHRVHRDDFPVGDLGAHFVCRDRKP